MNAAIELTDLSKQFGAKRAVDHLSLRIPEGSLYGLIGPNGAGKTTTFSLLAGFLKPSGGTIAIRGVPIQPLEPRRGRLSVLPQDAALPLRESARSLLTYLARLQGVVAAEAVATRALERLGLGPIADQRIGALSHGQRRRVAIAQTILGEGEIVLLDEPTAGLDPQVAAELRALVRELHRERTIVISSHNLAEIEQLCDHAAIIAAGRVISEGPMDTLRGAGALVRVFLAAPPPSPEGLQAALSAVPGVRRVAAGVNDPLRLDVEVEDDAPGRADAIVGKLLERLLASGAILRSLERGKSLEQRFLEDTSAAPGSKP